MEEFVKIFNNAMELSCLGLYEKVQDKSEQGIYKQSLLLKKALDRFSLLNITYSLYDENGDMILPSDETTLIKTFNFPIKDMIDRLPECYSNELNNSEWYIDESYINIGNNNCYYCTSELLDKLNYRIFRKTNEALYKELELESQKFIELLFNRNQEEYCEIRNFLEQREHAFITNTMFLEKSHIRSFKNKYPEIFEAAYQRLNYNKANLKICHHCGLVLKELNDGTLYCVSDRCSQKSKGFSTYNEIRITDDRIWVLRLNVSRYIYYPGILEQKIKKILQSTKISPILWPDKDTWDFKIEIEGKSWVIDAKDVKNPKAIQDDIIMKQKIGINYDRVLYIVPTDRKKGYIEAVERVIVDKRKIQCITLTDFMKMIFEIGRCERCS